MRSKYLFLVVIFLSIGFENVMAQMKSLVPQPITARVSEKSYCIAGIPGAYIYVDVYGGVPPYSFLWSNGSTSKDLDSVIYGVYTLTITDSLGAVKHLTDSIDFVPQVPVEIYIYGFPVSGQNNGAVIIDEPDHGHDPFHMKPEGNYSSNLYYSDSLGHQLAPITSNLCVWRRFTPCISPSAVFTNLKSGYYGVWNTYSVFMGGQTDDWGVFRLDSVPDVNPSVHTIPDCLNSSLGEVNIRANFNPNVLAKSLPFLAPANWKSYGQTYNGNQYVYNLKDSLTGVVKYQVSSIDSIVNFVNVAGGKYLLEVWGKTDYSYSPAYSERLVHSGPYFTVDNDTACSVVSGQLFSDIDRNCTFSGNDLGIPGSLIELNPGGFASSTDINGNYRLAIPPGQYSLKQYSPSYFTQKCPDTLTYTLNNPSNGNLYTLNIADSVNTNPDIQVSLDIGLLRPGGVVYMGVNVKNLTPNTIPSTSLKLKFDSLLTNLSSSFTPTAQGIDSVVWTTSSMSAFSSRHFTLGFQVDTSIAIGTRVNAMVTLGPVLNEINLANNVDSTYGYVRGSFDPNFLSVVPEGKLTPGFISSDQALEYTIHFQNTGNDTALRVFVVDSLPDGLDLATIKILDSSHPCVFSYTASTGNAVKFNFPYIILPDSGTNNEGSNGYVKFSVQQKQGNGDWTSFVNRADIYFDYNQPVSTNSVLNTVMDCRALKPSLSLDSVICRDRVISLSYALPISDSIMWRLDGQEVSHDSLFEATGLSPGQHIVGVTITDSICNVSDSILFSVVDIPAVPLVTVSNNQLESTPEYSYQWLRDTTPIPSATTMQFVPHISGNYSVIVADIYGCTSSSTEVFLCAPYATASVADSTLCFGDPLNGRASFVDASASGWYLDHIIQTTDSLLKLDSLLPGNYLLEFIVADSLCSRSTSLAISVAPSPAKPPITVTANILSTTSAGPYQWYKSGRLLQGSTFSTYTAFSSGYYSVAVFGPNGCSTMSDSVYIGMVGIGEPTTNASVIIQPIPATDYVELSGIAFRSGDEITLVDLVGKTVFKKVNQEQTDRLKIDLKELPPAMYIVQVKGKDRNYIGRLVKAQ